MGVTTGTTTAATATATATTARGIQQRSLRAVYWYFGPPRAVIAPRQPRRFTSSWFSFRPQSRLSIGLTIGYPVAFPSWHDPYIVGTPGYVKPYMAYGGVNVFMLELRDADLWVDGEYIGRVSDYTSYDPPLTLVAGRHHIELSGGARAIEFDITVVSGQVIPYQGTLPYVR